MKKIKLNEAGTLSSYDKMQLFNQGQRRENLRACGTSKLLDYYRICIDNKFKRAERQIAAELIHRGLGTCVLPQTSAINVSQFTPYEAQFILANKDHPAKILDAAITHPFPNLTESETLLIYLIWCIVLDLPEAVNKIKILFRNHQPGYHKIPEIIDEILAIPEVAEIISKIINKLPHTNSN